MNSAIVDQPGCIFMDHIRTAVVVYDRDAEIVAANAQARDLFGLTEAAIADRGAAKNRLTLLKSDGSPLSAGEHPVVSAIRNKSPVAGLTFRINRPDRGDTIWTSVSADPLFSDNGEPDKVVVTFTDITEQKRYQELFQKTFDASPAMTSLVNLRTLRMVAVNKATLNNSGYSADEILGKSTEELNVFVDPRVLAKILETLQKQGAVRDFEIEIRTKHGAIKKGFLNAELVTLEGVPHLLPVFMDATEMLKASAELAESEERFRAMFEQSPFGAAMLDANFHIYRANRAFLEMLGYDARELADLTVEKITHPEHLPAYADNLYRLIKGETPIYRAHKRYIKKDGSIIWGDVTLSLVRDSKGEFICCLIMIEDITERKRAEAKLAVSEGKYRTIVDNMTDALFIHDMEGRILEVNDNACRMLGYAKQELKQMDLTQIVHKDTQGGKEEVKRYLEEHDSLSFEAVMARKDGALIHAEVICKVVSRDQKGIVFGFVRNVTEKKKMEEELRRAQKLEALGVLAGGIAHDFNNLLIGVFGFMDLARRSLNPGDVAAEYLSRAFGAYERAKGLSHQLLTFAKGGTPSKEPLPVAEILRECCELALSGSNVTNAMSIPADICAIEADRIQISQMFSNILINARQAMPDGGFVTITASNRFFIKDNHLIPLKAGKYVAIAIQDQGIGIPAKIIDRIFDPFFTTKQQGSGIGLAMSYSISKRHDGHIEVESVPGAGTTFTVWLPASDKAVYRPRKISDKDVPVRKGRILLMDDEPNIRETACAMLRDAGYDAVAAPEGKAAVAKYLEAIQANARFDLVILDLTVRGGMGGEKTLAELKKIDPAVFACVSSGYSESPVIADYAAYGFKAVIAKPYMTEELLDVVRKAIV